MTEITFDGVVYTPSDGETVLDLLDRHGHAVPNSCRSGICQSCLMKATAGTPPPEAQKGLKDTLRAQGYFLACRCVPTEPMTVALPGEGFRHEAVIRSIRKLSPRVLELRVAAPEFTGYRGGQFVTLINRQGVSRSYSIASVPDLDGDLLFQIAILPGGAMSSWLAETAKEGETITIQGPNGNCFYVSGRTDQPLLLIGTGTGLAPLYAIVRDALHQGHMGAIHLYHGSVRLDGLYLVEELRALEKAHANFTYGPCVLEGPAEGMHIGPIDVHALDRVGSLKGWRVFLCGAPDLVKPLQRKVFLAGASMQEIFSDPFVPAPAKLPH